MEEAAFIEVSAEVRYWEDASINGKKDSSGDQVPFRDGDLWKPVIRLVDGMIVNWPGGIKADIHYKVADQGEYWLRDAAGRRIAKWNGYYVPDDYLCHGDIGYGDYIIFEVAENGLIEKWERPVYHAEYWEALDAEPCPDQPLRYMTLPVNSFAVCSEDEVEVVEDVTSYEQAEALLNRLRNECPNQEWTLIAEVDV